MQTPVVDILIDFKRVADEQELGWYLFGAQEVLIHGQPRFSDDVDITVKVDSDVVSSFVEALKQRGFDLQIEDENTEDFLEARGRSSLSMHLSELSAVR